MRAKNSITNPCRHTIRKAAGAQNVMTCRADDICATPQDPTMRMKRNYAARRCHRSATREPVRSLHDRCAWASNHKTCMGRKPHAIGPCIFRSSSLFWVLVSLAPLSDESKLARLNATCFAPAPSRCKSATAYFRALCQPRAPTTCRTQAPVCMPEPPMGSWRAIVCGANPRVAGEASRKGRAQLDRAPTQTPKTRPDRPHNRSQAQPSSLKHCAQAQPRMRCGSCDVADGGDRQRTLQAPALAMTPACRGSS